MLLQNLIVAAGLVAGPSMAETPPATPSSQAAPEPPMDEYRLALDGAGMSQQDAQRMEEKLKESPANLVSRIQLAGYYFSKESEEEQAARRNHVLWIIENAPQNKIAGSPFCLLDPIQDPKGFGQTKALWDKHLRSNPDSAAILENIAFFLSSSGDDQGAERVIQRLIIKEPNEPKWPSTLGRILHSKAQKESDLDRRREYAKQAVTALEQALAITKDGDGKFYLLSDLTKASVETGDETKSEKLAKGLLEEAAHHKNDWNFGNAIHEGNAALGRIALKKGDLPSAKAFLLKAGATRGSPQLNSFGPNMTLAKELLAKNEREAVLAYFLLCGKFWESGKDRLTQWTDEVKQGKTPDFGANLDY